MILSKEKVQLNVSFNIEIYLKQLLHSGIQELEVLSKGSKKHFRYLRRQILICYAS